MESECPPVKAACVYSDLAGSLHLELISSLKESVVLLFAFILGWCLFRPAFRLFFGHRLNSVQRASGAANPCKLREDLKAEAHHVALDSTESSCPKAMMWSSHAISLAESRCQATAESDNFRVPGQEYHLALARTRARQQDVAGSRSCIEAVRCAGGIVDRRTSQIFMRACVQSGKMDMAAARFMDAIQQGWELDMRCFSLLVDGFCCTGDLEKAMMFFEMMLEQQHRPDAASIDALLACSLSQGRLKLLQKVMKVVEDFELPPSNSYLAARIRLCTARGELSQALDDFKELPKQFGFVPNAYVHGVLISTCYAFGQLESAIQVYQSMLSCGCQPDAKTYECLIRCCCGVGQFQEAVALVDEAFGLQKGSSRRTFIDAQVVEELLIALGRRGQAVCLGLPLVLRLQAANIEISEKIAAALVRAAASTENTSAATRCARERQRRRMEFQHWRHLRTARGCE